jgi:hypothetical protein
LRIAVTVFGIFTDNREMLAGVLKIVTYGIMFSCGWAGGTSLLRPIAKKLRNTQNGVKVLGFDLVSPYVECQRTGEENVLQTGSPQAGTK